jgi:hypothetical protein
MCFDGFDVACQAVIQTVAVLAVVNFPMAVWANSPDPLWLVWATIRKSPNVMWFEVRRSIVPPERR